METVMLYGDRLEMEKWIAVVDGRFVVVVGVKFYPKTCSH